MNRIGVWSRLVVSVWLLVVLGGCSHPEVRPRQVECSELEERINFSRRIDTLNTMAEAFSAKCYVTVISQGARAQTEFRHKTFSTLKESASIFLPDGTLTDYVLESYERGYLGVLVASSYLHLGNIQEVKVELRRLDHELFAPLYNFGEDPVNILLSAVLWERTGDPYEARVDWLRLQDLPGLLKGPDEPLRTFAAGQVARIDEGRERRAEWRVYGVESFPGIDWDLQFFGSSNGYFLLRPTTPFPSTCQSETGLMISTRSWFEKIGIRHSHKYHPLLNMQAWIRLPIGIVYSLVPLTTGAGIVVGGCLADATLSARHGGGALCQLSIVGGMALMMKTPEVLSSSLEPDLRHWDRVPAAFIVTRAATLAEEPCARDVEAANRMRLF